MAISKTQTDHFTFLNGYKETNIIYITVIHLILNILSEQKNLEVKLVMEINDFVIKMKGL